MENLPIIILLFMVAVMACLMFLLIKRESPPLEFAKTSKNSGNQVKTLFLWDADEQSLKMCFFNYISMICLQKINNF